MVTNLEHKGNLALRPTNIYKTAKFVEYFRFVERTIISSVVATAGGAQNCIAPWDNKVNLCHQGKQVLLL